MQRSFTRVGATLVAAFLAVQGTGSVTRVFADEAAVLTNTDSSSQMSSSPETVFVNKYGSKTERTQNFDSNWKFYLGDAAGAQNPTFDDSSWRSLNLPHDYSIEQEYSKAGEAESGYLLGGIGWYRKNFTIDESLKDQRVRLDFDGVYMNATVYVNGVEVGTHPYGYTPFSFDITDQIHFGKENTVAVKVNHQTPSSRWYSGSGIYRSVNLTTTNGVHVDLNGVSVTTPKLKENNTDTNIKTTVKNDSKQPKKITVVNTIFKKGDDATKNIGTKTSSEKTVAAGEVAEITNTIKANNPTLWDTEHPTLYTVRTEVKVGNEVVDTYDTDYGFRYTEFKKDTGFYLNGKAVKLKGVCMHHDQGALGSVANRDAMERQVKILKDMGCNSIRVTHNPAAKEFIDICNENGILVVEEIFDGWMHAKNGNSNDFSSWFNKKIEEGNKIMGKHADETWAEFDLKATLKRDQNDPSVIMWSLGNEIQEGAGGSGYEAKATELIKWGQEADPTRPLTVGSNALKNENGSGTHTNIGNQLDKVNGAVGTNYSDGNSYDKIHKLHPDWELYGSETASSVNSRGVYYTKGQDNASQQVSAYDTSKVPWGAFAKDAWFDVVTRDFVAGEYVWTGFDYIGEPTPWNGTDKGPKGTWPSPKNSYFGIVDTAGLPKDSYYFYQSQWNDDVNTLHILPTWNENGLVKNGGKVEVVAYTDAASVELWLTPEGSDKAEKVGDAVEFETKTTKAGHKYHVVKGKNDMYAKWQIPFRAGKLELRAKDETGKAITKAEGRSFVQTTGAANKIDLRVNHEAIDATGKDLAYVTISVTDAQGNIIPDAANNVKVEVTGNGTLVGLDNGCSPDHTSYKGTERKVFNGQGIAIVQSTDEAGTISVTASSEGLESKTIQVTTNAVPGDNTKKIKSFEYPRVYYVKTGTQPTLPTTLKATCTDKTTADVNVTWDEIPADKINTNGSFIVNGTADGVNVAVSVNMIDDVAALLNYSTTTMPNTVPTLPASRQAILPDGTVLSASFPVTWEQKDASSYGEVGSIVTVNGTAQAFGKTLPVTATVRVANETITIGDSVTKDAHLEQDIPADKQSDTLNAIKDGSTTIGDNNDGGANETCWSNWKNATQQGANNDPDAVLKFWYDTQQRIGNIVIHFARDNGAMQFPVANTTEIFVSENGQEGSWTKVEATEQIGEEKNRVKAYTYNLAQPVTATFVKVKVVAQNTKCVGITEVELKKAEGTYNTNTTAKFASLTIDGKEINVEELGGNEYCTPVTDATKVVATAKDNASLTVLPVHNNDIHMLLESEDHATVKKFTVRLGQPETLLPNDDSRDYPVAKITATAASSYPGTGNEGPASHVLDNNTNTHWHTNWSTNEAADVNKRTITLEMHPAEGEEYPVLDGMRYQRRQNGGKNGAVRDYKIECSMDGQKWEKVAEGQWDVENAGWQVARFTKPTQAKYVRLTGVHTVADSGNDKHMAIAELRVTYQQNTTPNPDPQPEPQPEAPKPVITGSAPSTQEGFGPEKAVDGNLETYWHSAYNEVLTDENRYFQLNFEKPYTVSKLTYVPKQGMDENNGDKNGTVTKYTVLYSLDGETWKEAAKGDWEVSDATKFAEFAEPVEAKYIRLVGNETFGVGGQNNKFMSAVEIGVETVAQPSPAPTEEPSVSPKPTAKPTAKPTVEPTAEPTAKPTAKPTAEPTAEPTDKPEKDDVIVTYTIGKKSVKVHVDDASKTMKEVLPKEVELKANQVFKGWFTEPNGKGTKIDLEQPVSAYANTKVKAIQGEVEVYAYIVDAATGNPSNDKRPATGDARSAMPWAFVLAGALAAGFVIKKH